MYLKLTNIHFFDHIRVSVASQKIENHGGASSNELNNIMQTFPIHPSYQNSINKPSFHSLFRTACAMYGGSRKNNLKLRRKRHKVLMESARTDSLAKIIKRRRKVQNLSLKHDIHGQTLALRASSTMSDNSTSATTALAPRPPTGPRDIELNLPIFRHPTKALRRASRMKKSTVDKSAERRRKKMRARFEEHGRCPPARKTGPTQPL
jgi:hypothetical protein